MRTKENKKIVAFRWALCGILTVMFCVTCLQSVNAQKYNMTYLYGAGDYISMVNNTEGTLNEVSPSYFDIDEKGNLKLNAVDDNLVSKMHAQGIKVVPFFSNHWDRDVGRAAIKNRDKIVTDIVNVVKNHHLDGINIDLENLTEADRENYVAMAKLFREKLPADKSLVISVAANPHDYQTGWHGSYDYEQLGKYADYLMVMAYDEHYEGGEAGPVAGIEFVEKSIQYAVSKVDKSKVVLGIPLYGRYWKENVLYGGAAVSLEKMSEIVKNYNCKVTFDEASKSPKAVLTLGVSDTKPKIYAKTLTQGTYIFWYEDETSIRAKLELVNKYDIKGVGSWRLGMEEKSMWEIFKEMLQDNLSIHNIAFKDVATNHWANDAITFLKEKGWVSGRTEDLFAPEENLTRGEMAAVICRMLNLDAGVSVTSSNYTDVQNHWAQNYIVKLNELSVVNGYTDGSFRQNRSNLTSLLVQPISASLVAKLISLPKDGTTNGACRPLELPNNGKVFNIFLCVL